MRKPPEVSKLAMTEISKLAVLGCLVEQQCHLVYTRQHVLLTGFVNLLYNSIFNLYYLELHHTL